MLLLSIYPSNLVFLRTLARQTDIANPWIDRTASTVQWTEKHWQMQLILTGSFEYRSLWGKYLAEDRW